MKPNPFQNLDIKLNSNFLRCDIINFIRDETFKKYLLVFPRNRSMITNIRLLLESHFRYL